MADAREREARDRRERFRKFPDILGVVRGCAGLELILPFGLLSVGVEDDASSGADGRSSTGALTLTGQAVMPPRYIGRLKQ